MKLGGIPTPYAGFGSIKVLDFTKLLPGPYATQILADMGCKVTKIELPHFKDEARYAPPLIEGLGALYRAINRGKEELTVDFRKPEGLAKVFELVDGADVLIEGFRPGLMERSGLGEAAVRARNPRLVYCSLVGYPSGGPMAKKAGHDLNFLSLSGMLGLQSGDARVLPAQLADLSGSLAAVAAILAALLEREKTGAGRRVEVAMSECAHSLLPIPLSELAADGREPSGPRWWNGAHPFYRLYETKGGGRLAVAALEKPFALTLLDALGLSELKPLADDPLANAARLVAELSSVLLQATRDEWVARLEGKDCCVTPVLSLSEAAALQR